MTNTSGYLNNSFNTSGRTTPTCSPSTINGLHSALYRPEFRMKKKRKQKQKQLCRDESISFS